MNCLAVEAGLADFVAQRASSDWIAAAGSHAAECPECAELWELVRNVPETSPGQQLTRSILERTSGLPCRQVRRALKDRPGSSSTADRIGGHLDHCPECRLWALWMLWLQTPPQPAGRGWFGGAADFFERLLRRPRFGFEAAYAGAVLFLLLAGNIGGLPGWLRNTQYLAEASVVELPLEQTLQAGEIFLAAQFEAGDHWLDQQWERGTTLWQDSRTKFDRSSDEFARTLVQVRNWTLNSISTLRKDPSTLWGEPDPRPVR